MVTANSADFSRLVPTVDVLWRDLVAASLLSELLLGTRSCLRRSKFLESQFHLSGCLSNSMVHGACEPRAMRISWKFSFWNFQQLLVKVALNSQVFLFFLFLFKNSIIYLFLDSWVFFDPQTFIWLLNNGWNPVQYAFLFLLVSEDYLSCNLSDEWGSL